MVVNEFFESFHLNDVREQLWNWVVELVSSSNSISSEPLERSNHIYFYEKMEELIEACFIIKNQALENLQKEEEMPVVPA